MITAFEGINPCLPIMCAVADNAGDDVVLALSRELAEAICSVQGGDEQAGLLGFVIARLCRAESGVVTLAGVFECLECPEKLSSLLESTIGEEGAIGALGEGILRAWWVNARAFWALRSGAAGLLAPFASDERLKVLTSGGWWTFEDVKYWEMKRTQLQSVARPLMPIFDWAAGKRFAMLEAGSKRDDVAYPRVRTEQEEAERYWERGAAGILKVAAAALGQCSKEGPSGGETHTSQAKGFGQKRDVRGPKREKRFDPMKARCGWVGPRCAWRMARRRKV